MNQKGNMKAIVALFCLLETLLNWDIPELNSILSTMNILFSGLGSQVIEANSRYIKEKQKYTWGLP